MAFWDINGIKNSVLSELYPLGKIKSRLKEVYKDVMELRKWLYKYIIVGLGTIQKNFLESTLNTVGKDGWYLSVKNDDSIDLVDPSTLPVDNIYISSIIPKEDDPVSNSGLEKTYIDMSICSLGNTGGMFSSYWGQWVTKGFPIDDIGSDLNNFDAEIYNKWVDKRNVPYSIKSYPAFVDSSNSAIFVNSESAFTDSVVQPLVKHSRWLQAMGHVSGYNVDFWGEFAYPNPPMVASDIFNNDSMHVFHGKIAGAEMLGLTDMAVEIEFSDEIDLLIGVQEVGRLADPSLPEGLKGKMLVQYILDFDPSGENEVVEFIYDPNDNSDLMMYALLNIQATGNHKVIVKYESMLDESEYDIDTGNYPSLVKLIGFFVKN